MSVGKVTSRAVMVGTIVVWAIVVVLTALAVIRSRESFAAAPPSTPEVQPVFDSSVQTSTARIVSVGTTAVCVTYFMEPNVPANPGLPYCVEPQNIDVPNPATLDVGDCVEMQFRHPISAIQDRKACPEGRQSAPLLPPMGSRELAMAADSIGVPGQLTPLLDQTGDVADCRYCTRLTRWYCGPADSDATYRDLAEHFRRAGLHVYDEYMGNGKGPVASGKTIHLSVDPFGRSTPPETGRSADSTPPAPERCPDGSRLVRFELKQGWPS